MASLGDLFVTVGANITGFSQAMGKAKTEVTGMSGLFQKFGTTASLGLGAIGAGAFAAANKFNNAFVKIGNATGATGEKLDALSKSFTNVYKQVDESSEQVAEALSLIATRTGLTGKALEGMTVKLLDLAKVQNESISSLTPEITRAFGDWSIATEKQSDALDFLGTVSQQTGTKVTRLSGLVVQFGAPMRELGYTFEQATALIAKFDKEGVNVETVLAGMKKALSAFAAAGKDPAVEWQKFVAGVRSGAVSLEETMKLVGVRLGTDVFKAIQEGRFEIDKTVGSYKALAQEGLKTTDTLMEQWTKYGHSIEAAISKHSDVIVSIGLLGPSLVKAFSALFKYLGVSAAVGAANATGALLGAAIIKGVIDGVKGDLPEMFGQKWTIKPGGPNLPFTIESTPTTGMIAPGEFRGESESRLEHRKATAPGITPPTTPGTFTMPETGKKTTHHAPFEFVGPMESYFGTPFAVEAMQRQIAATDQLMDAIVSLSGTGMIAAAKLRAEWQAQGAGFKDLGLQVMNTQPMIAMIAEVDMSKIRGGILETEDAMNSLGLTSTRALRAAYDGALRTALAIAQLRAEGKATDSDLTAAMGKVAEAHKQLSERLNGTQAAMKNVRSAAQELAEDLDQMARRTFAGLEQDIAHNIVAWKGWSESIKNIGRGFAQDFLQIMLKVLLKPLEDAFAKVVVSIGGHLGTLLGIGGSAAGTAIKTAGGAAASTAATLGGAAASTAASAGQTAAKVGGQVAGMGVSAITGMVTGAISAVSGVIGNFQMAGMNKSLDVIVNHTLRQFNETVNFRTDQWSQHNQMYERVGEIWNTLKAGTPGAPGVGGVTIDLRNSTFHSGVTKSTMQDAFQQMYREAVAAVR